MPSCTYHPNRKRKKIKEKKKIKPKVSIIVMELPKSSYGTWLSFVLNIYSKNSFQRERKVLMRRAMPLFFFLLLLLLFGIG